MNEKIVILGNSGFIGKSLQRYLNSFYKVYGFDSEDCNLLVYESLNNSLKDIKNIKSLIFCSSITRLQENSFDSMDKNIKMAQNVAQFVSKTKVGQLIFLSSIDIYGIMVKEPYKETLPILPNDYYAASKAVSELILQQVCKEKGVNLFIPRLSGVFGKGDTKKSTIYHLVSSALNNKKIILYNGGEDYRDFVNIDILSSVINNSISQNYNGILNIATGESYKIKEIADIIKSIKQDIKIIYKENEIINRSNKIKFDISLLLQSNLLSDKVLTLKEYIKIYIDNIE